MTGRARAGDEESAAAGGRFSLPLLLAAIGVIAVNMRVTITGVGPLLEQMSETTGNSVTVLSTLTSVPVFTWALLSPFAHPAARRFGLNRVVLAALVLLAIGTAVRSLPGPEFSLWFGTALIGVSLALANVLLPAVVKRSFGTRVPLVTSMYTALFAGCGALAAGAVVPLSHAVEPGGGDTGWRFALAAVVATLPIALVLWIAHMRGFGPDAGHPRAGRAARGPSVWGDPVAWIVGGYMGVQAILFYVMITWLAPYSRSLGRTELVAGFDSMIFQVVGVIGSLALPLVMRGRMERWVPAALPLLTIAGIGGILLAPGALIVWIILAGLCSGASIACALTLMATRAPDHQSASALSGMAQSVGYVIAALAPITFGALHTATGGWTASFLFVLAAAVAQLVLGLAAGRDRHVFEHRRG
ncbi:MFS transporter [Microbacterium sp. Marseille-Q6965]|uniref:MFS transporter n=1 Tax=Microbacterium sp. Marseille-Q6965 TaxID=2965072 RepID=UPI0021B7F119|nr:MFS transporter [Microbacterium sp. Marseille-Q6965]